MAEKKEAKKSVYQTLSEIDVKPYLKQAGSVRNKETGEYTPLNYLPWANAWALVKAVYPTANYTIREYPNYVCTADGGFQAAGTLDYRITKVGCEVEVTAIIEGEKYTQKLYPMDQKNRPIMNPNIAQINKAQMRCLVKALAIAGLGLDVFAGEDIPIDADDAARKYKAVQKEKLSTAMKRAKAFEIEYGGSTEKLVYVCYLAKHGKGDEKEQAQRCLESWQSKDPKHKQMLRFIKENALERSKEELEESNEEVA